MVECYAQTFARVRTAANGCLQAFVEVNPISYPDRLDIQFHRDGHLRCVTESSIFVVTPRVVHHCLAQVWHLQFAL